MLKTQVLADSSKAEELLVKCTGKATTESVKFVLPVGSFLNTEFTIKYSTAYSVQKWIIIPSALEALCSRKDGELACKDEMIAKLQQKLNELELSHRREIQELKVQMQQEVYMAQKNEQQTKYGRKHK